MIPLLNVGIKPIKVNGRKNYTTVLEAVVMTQIEANGKNGQESLDLPRISFYMAPFSCEGRHYRVLRSSLDCLCVFISHFTF